MTTTTTDKLTGYDASASLNVWVGNLRKYNEGELCGDWIALPCPDVWGAVESLGIDIDTDEYHLPDWDCNIPGLEYSEWADLDELNKIAETWDGLEDYEREAVAVRLELCGEEFYEALENRDDVRIWYGCRDMGEVAREYVDECGLLHGVPDGIAHTGRARLQVNRSLQKKSRRGRMGENSCTTRLRTGTLL